MKRALVAVCLAGCVAGKVAPDGGSPPDGSPPDGETPVLDGATPDAAAGLEGGSLDVAWMHGSEDCAQNTDPAVQVHAYNPTTIIFRQNKCQTFEAPFMYLLVGSQSALLLDSGDTTSPALRDAVRSAIGDLPLLVAHSHAHGDHTRGDGTFAAQPATSVVGTSRAAVQAAFGIATWPTDAGSYDLGDRILDVLAIPGHQQSHIAIYDRRTGLLLTGDTLYPGLLFINDWTSYRDSVHRLAGFAASHPIAHVLGAHIEMTSTATESYPYGTTYQPAEHALPLTAGHVAELDAALTALGPSPPAQPVAHDDFVIDPQ
jgi:hydroxyacylglutathione hydrolase